MGETSRSKHHSPLVSIIITSYNRAHFLEQAIRSALLQDYPNLEIIISDNCSTDHTVELIGQFLSDKRIKFFRNKKNIGMLPNFKLATERASGEYISYLSSDDYLPDPQFVSKAVQLVGKYENVVLVFGKNESFIEKQNKLVPNDDQLLYKTEFRKGKELFLEFGNSYAYGWGGTLILKKALDEI